MDGNFNGQILAVLIIALVFSAIAGLLIGGKYKNRVLAFMQRGDRPNNHSIQPTINPQQQDISLDSVSFRLNQQNKKAICRFRLIVVFIGVLLSFVITLFYLKAAALDEPLFLSFKRTGLIFLVNAWVIVPSVGLLERWSNFKIIVLSFAYATFVIVLIVLLSANTFIDMLWMYAQQLILFPFVLLSTSSRLRTLGPYLFFTFCLLLATSLIGFHALNNIIAENNSNSWIVGLSSKISAHFTFGLFLIGPWLIGFYPLWLLTKKIAKWYEAKIFSEYLYLLTSFWLFILLFHALQLTFSLNALAYLMLFSILIIYVVFFILKSTLNPKHHPPTLLLLRVFREDKGIKKIFNKVLNKWKYTGNTVMIAGDDLAVETLEPDELFGFLNGKLVDRFISNNQQLQQKIAQLDFNADPDGSYRVNELLCFDTTWKLALDASIAKSHLVLMDLRDYHSGRKGCSYELGAIANSTHLQKVVILINSKTDVKTAKEFLVGDVREKVFWVKDEFDSKNIEEEILGALLE